MKVMGLNPYEFVALMGRLRDEQLEKQHGYEGYYNWDQPERFGNGLFITLLGH